MFLINIKISHFNNISLRTKKYILGASWNVISQAASSVISLVITGMLARYFTSEQFGVWSLTAILFGLFLGIDLGFGNSLKNRLSLYYANNNVNDNENARVTYYSIFHVFLIWTILLSIVIIFIRGAVPWNKIIKTENQILFQQSVQILVIASVLFCINSAFQIYSHGFYAYQETQYVSIINLLNKIVIFCFIIFAVYYKIGYYSINITYFIIVIIISIIGFVFFSIKRKWYNVVVSLNQVKSNFIDLFNHSLQFAILQLISLISSNIDMFIISNKMGLSVVGDYALVKKIYLFAMSFHVIILFPLWPAFTEAMVKKDIRWIKSALNKIVLLSMIAFFSLSIFLYFFGNKVVYLWSGKLIHLSVTFLLMGILYTRSAVGSCYSILLNSINKLKWQILIGFAGLLALIPLSNYLIRLFSINGLILSLITISIPGIFYLYFHVKKILHASE